MGKDNPCSLCREAIQNLLVGLAGLFRGWYKAGEITKEELDLGRIYLGKIEFRLKIQRKEAEDMRINWSSIFRYGGLIVEAAAEAADAYSTYQAAKDPDSPGGTEVTEEEKKQIIENLDDNFARVSTRICEEVGLPVESISVTVKLK